MSSMLDYAALQAAAVQPEPYPYFIVPNFINTAALPQIMADYPKLTLPGSFPLPSLAYGQHFKAFMQELQGQDMAKLVGEKLGMDLTTHPTMVTVRGMCRPSDGQIHTDSVTKLVTVLLYMNGQWEQTGGRLRLLCSANNLQDYVAEVPPAEGTLLVFKNQSNAWHGHESCSGERRVIQLNWVRDRGVVWREQLRHRLSAFMKRRRNAMGAM